MGEAKRRRPRNNRRFECIDQELINLGVDTSQWGFYDQPKFLAEESRDHNFLEKYAEWVNLRPFNDAYAEHVRGTVPRLTKLVHSEFVEHGFEGGCVAASGMISRILDRLGVWSFAVAGSLTLEVDGGRIRRMLHSVDEPDFAGAALGHAWVVAPPYQIMDATISLQHWAADEMGRHLPEFILAAKEARKIRPTVGDVVSDKIRAQAAVAGYPDSDLHYRLEPRLRAFGAIFPAFEVSRGQLILHYVPVAIRQTDVPLEQINDEGDRGRPAIEFWREKIIPEFNLSYS